jgi:hypothetical protein
MAVSGASKVYKEHIRALPVKERLELLALIAEELVVEGLPTSEGERHSLAELYGIGQGVWEGIDAQEYVNQLRDEPDDRTP